MSGAMHIEGLRQQLETLTLFRPLLGWPVLQKLMALLEQEVEITDRPGLYCEFVQSVYQNGADFAAALLREALQVEHLAVRLQGAGQPLPEYLEQNLERELDILERCAGIQCRDMMIYADGESVSLPAYQSSVVELKQQYLKHLQKAATNGYGVFAQSHMLVLGSKGELRPVPNPDPQTLEGLTGYEQERKRVLWNTQALLEKMPANNILLYGDAGTGKSSTVKAVANRFKHQGLRLVEVRKEQLHYIPELMGRLAKNPLKFILFIDDLSFAPGEGGFTELKAILEGTVAARPENIVVYATSNRRHMVQERFSDRQGDDLHLADTLEESGSLAARFGVLVTFLRPDKELYLDIVREYAKNYNLSTPEEQLFQQAEAYALRSGGRSPRTARQFTEFLKTKELFGEE